MQTDTVQAQTGTSDDRHDDDLSEKSNGKYKDNDQVNFSLQVIHGWRGEEERDGEGIDGGRDGWMNKGRTDGGRYR